MKGIILSGGYGTRLYPITKSISKQLVPVYDKPMIYYSLSTFIEGGIKDILIITNKEYLNTYKKLLNNGSDYGLKISYSIQNKPKGIAEAFIIGKKFIADDNVALILGDNIFYGENIKNIFTKSEINLKKNLASIVSKEVVNFKMYGVAKLNKKNKLIKIIEKPKKDIGNLAITGLYFYPNDVTKKVNLLKPSKRNELEITDLNNLYISENRMKLYNLQKETSWFDMGTHESLLESSMFIAAIEKRQSRKIGCIEEVAFNNKYISKKKFDILKKRIPESSYKEYLNTII